MSRSRRRRSPGLPPVFQSVITRRPRPVRQRVVRGLAALLVLALVLGAGAGAILIYAHFKVKGNQESVEVASPRPEEPTNVLILGSDSREGLSPDQQEEFGDTEVVPGKRADTIIMLHLDEQREKAVLVHFPRDLRVRYPDGEMGKINGIYELGPDAMVGTVSNFTGMPIHHYLEVDFNGFNEIAGAIGGVEVFFEHPVHDVDSGLSQPRGCVTIDGDQALAFVRARKLDDDFGRIQRQQLFMKLMVERIATPAVVLRPDRVVSLVNVFSRSVTYDANLSLTDLRDIALRLRGFSSDNLDMRVVPSAGARIDGVSYVVAHEMQTRELFGALAAGEPLPDYGRTGVSAIDPEDVRVSMLNGTEVDLLAFNEGEVLASRGFLVVESANAPPHDQTAVYYSEGFQDQGRLLANTYGVVAQELPANIGAIGHVAVVLGEDFAASKASEAPESDPESVEPPLSPQPPPPEPQPRPPIRACDP